MSDRAREGIERVAQALAADPFDGAALCEAIDRFVQPLTAHALFTVNRFEAAAMRLTRVYSSNPLAYPPGGSKEKAGTAWGRHVLIDKRMFVGEGLPTIRSFFDDAAAIEELRLRSVVNAPVIEGGQCIGTVNVLLRSEEVSPQVRSVATVASLLVVPALRPGVLP